MPIVSLSFPESMMKEMDELQQALGFTGRSELVRASIRLMLQDVKEKNALVGKGSAVIVLTHTEENEEPVTTNKAQVRRHREDAHPQQDHQEQLRRDVPSRGQLPRGGDDGEGLPEGRRHKERKARHAVAEFLRLGSMDEWAGPDLNRGPWRFVAFAV